MTDEEIPLPGGDVTVGVVRVGDTVRRPLGDHSPTVHLVLRHLEAVGFDGAPRLLGTDERGREVLSFVPGEVADRPWPAWVSDEARGVSVARLLRRLDDALALLGLPSDLGLSAGVRSTPRRPEVPEPPGPPPTFLGHRDITPENTVFRDGRAYAVIDFDLVRPSTRVDEVGNLLVWWAGWMHPTDRNPVFAGVDPAARGRTLVDAYGLDAAERAVVVPVAVAGAAQTWWSMRERATTLGGGWARMWAEGVGDQIRRREQWLRAEGDSLTAALTR